MKAETEAIELIQRILSEKLEISMLVTPNTDLRRELSLDSLEWTILAAELENHFHIKLNEADAGALCTVSDLARWVVCRSEAASSPVLEAQ